MDDMSRDSVSLDPQTKYDEATRRAVDILKTAGSLKIIRFGSAARGSLHPESDLDLCVVVERTGARSIRQVRMELNRLLWEQYRACEVEVQLHVYYRDAFEDYLGRGDPFLQEVIKGQVVYTLPYEAGGALKEADAAYGQEHPLELAQIWLAAAAEDLAHARSALDHGFYAHACFSCQQAAEKSLKAYILARRQRPTRTHNLGKLLNGCVSLEKHFEDLSHACLLLNEYYVDTRYPDTLRFALAFSRDEAAAAVSAAESVLGLIRSRVARLLDGETD
jgi:HEPN domain-containing protein/predicted nucleotidyltransferase